MFLGLTQGKRIEKSISDTSQQETRPSSKIQEHKLGNSRNYLERSLSTIEDRAYLEMNFAISLEGNLRRVGKVSNSKKTAQK